MHNRRGVSSDLILWSFTKVSCGKLVGIPEFLWNCYQFAAAKSQALISS